MNREAAGAALRRLREARDLSLNDLAAATGLSPMALSYLERGIRKPRKDTTGKLEEGLGLPVGTYQRLVFAADPDAELQKIVSVARAVVPPPRNHHSTNGVTVGRRSATGALLGFASSNIDTITALIERIPQETAPDFEDYVSSVIDRCIQTGALMMDSWRLAVNAGSPDAAQLMQYLHTIEATRQALAARLVTRSLAAKLEVACQTSPLPDVLIAQLLDATAEDLWLWRNQGAIPADAIDAVQAFISMELPSEPAAV